MEIDPNKPFRVLKTTGVTDDEMLENDDVAQTLYNAACAGFIGWCR